MFKVPDLLYKYDALQPYISKDVMKIHHDEHHTNYVDSLNKALKSENINIDCISTLLKSMDKVPESIRESVKNNGGGHLNHSLFWESMTPNPIKMTDYFSSIVSSFFGSVDKFKKQFTEVANEHFDNGWIWLCVAEDNLVICETSGHNTPLVCGSEPILILDVWEHAYYLQYKNRKDKYIDAWWNIVDWKTVETRYKTIRLSNSSTIEITVIDELVDVADQLDQEGFIEEANEIDKLLTAKKKKHKTPWGKEKFYRCVDHVLDAGVEPLAGQTKREAAQAICGSTMWKSEKKKKSKKKASKYSEMLKMFNMTTCPECNNILEPYAKVENIVLDWCPMCQEVFMPIIENRDVLSFMIPDGDYANY